MLNSYFSRTSLNDLEFYFTKEYLITSGNGTFASSTICGCNTRKYHGLLITPQPQLDDNDHVLLSCIDETVKYKGNTYQLATHQYPSAVYPKGYEYLNGFYSSPIPKWIYKFEGITLTKELLLLEDNSIVLIRYTSNGNVEPLELQLMPFLAFRNAHHLSKANLFVNKKINPVSNGVKMRLYAQYSDLFMQLSKGNEFVPVPDWYYNIEYREEMQRGYSYQEDLYVPGYFKLKLPKDGSVVFSAGLQENSPITLNTKFKSALKDKKELKTLGDCLKSNSKNFIIKEGKKTFVKAGYPWFGCWGRDSFISLPGLTLTNGDEKTFKAVISSMLPDLKDGLFPNVGSGKNAAYNSIDASLWFIWAIQQYGIYTDSAKDVWKTYGKYLSSILSGYKKGTLHNIKMQDDGLISGGENGLGITWMDAVVAGKAITPRIGKPVEVNALWYNAIYFCLECAKAANDKKFIAEWQEYPSKIKDSFIKNFWDEEKGYLADYVHDDFRDWSIRPNQIFAVSLPYSPLTKNMSLGVVTTVKNELVTPRGLRTLTSKDPNYHGIYSGDFGSRDNAYHQGTVWTWLLGAFAEAYCKVNSDEAVPFLKTIFNGFEEALQERCQLNISEIYDGDYPHKAKGAISQAWSMAELARMGKLLENNGKEIIVEKVMENTTL